MSPATPISNPAEQLRQWQNPDGGWGYLAGGISWTEPTGLAILALQASDPSGDSLQKALTWLHLQRRADGGWSPQPAVRESTWVTAVSILALTAAKRLEREDPALAWLEQTQGAESGWVQRLRQWMLGIDTSNGGFDGWPWFPGAAAWVAPTAVTILAARAALAAYPSRILDGRLRSACGFLVSRRCADGGWNHGSSRALGYDGDSYPETTGMALLALAGTGLGKDAEPKIRQACEAGLRHYNQHPGIEAWSWLQMGLRAHSIALPAVPVPALTTRSPREVALYLLAGRFAEGKNPWTFEVKP